MFNLFNLDRKEKVPHNIIWMDETVMESFTYMQPQVQMVIKIYKYISNLVSLTEFFLESKYSWFCIWWILNETRIRGE